jgi:hypothetical protein
MVVLFVRELACNLPSLAEVNCTATIFDRTTRRRHVWWPRAAISASPCATNLLPTPCLRCSRNIHRSSTHSCCVRITPTIFSSKTATHANGQSSSLNSKGTGFGAKRSLNVSFTTVSIRARTELYSLDCGRRITISIFIRVF